MTINLRKKKQHHDLYFNKYISYDYFAIIVQIVVQTESDT